MVDATDCAGGRGSVADLAGNAVSICKIDVFLPFRQYIQALSCGDQSSIGVAPGAGAAERIYIALQPGLQAKCGCGLQGRYSALFKS